MNKQKRNQKSIEHLSFKEKMDLLTKADNSKYGHSFSGIYVGNSRPRKKR